MRSDEGTTFDTLLHSPQVVLPGRDILGERFRLRRRLGEGGFGAVYEAEDLRDGGSVALKLLRRPDASWLYRFKREFRSLQGIVHPNLVVLDELFGNDDQWYFTMELVDGVELVAYAAQRSTSPAPDVWSDTTVPIQSGVLMRTDVAKSEQSSGHSCAAIDERKLRESLRQLMEGLSALHARGKVHRDIKPSNVLVTRDGRVVIIDFGLVADSMHASDSTLVGTPAYMAPEQAASRELSPAADLYAVGVMLYQLLTRRMPIQGPVLQMLMDKQTVVPMPPAEVAPGVPADLNALCMRLLRVDPSERPSTSEVCSALAAASSTGKSPVSRPHDDAIFVGRRDELTALHAAFATLESGQLATVLVSGESGIGKTRLIRQFASQLLDQHPSTIWLEGRCHEREAIPYKTIDGIVDTLSRLLTQMPAAEVASLLPTRRALLARLFPALQRIPQLASRDSSAPLAASTDFELRQRAFLELRELFTRVAMHRPTVLFIDDLQWADDDGLLALTEMIAGPDAPPLLFVGALRGGLHAHDTLPSRLRALASGGRVLELRPLEAHDAHALASTLLTRTLVPTQDAEQVVHEAAGHPLFIEELVRHVAAGPMHAEPSLDEFIWSRVVQLKTPTRALVELVAAAGKPLAQKVAARATGLDPGAFRAHAALLRTANLVRSSGARWEDAIGPYHDRIREVVLARLDPAHRRTLHKTLAVAFESSSPDDLETLAFHWTEAGECARAGVYAAAAGDQATQTFAFDRAAAWFEQALALRHEDDKSRRELHIKLGNALALAGRGALAAPHFESAALDAPRSEALELRRRVAEQLLFSGHFDRGLEASRKVLRAIGMRFPTGRLQTLASLWYYSLRLRIRGLAFRARRPEEITPEEQMRLDVCFHLAKTLGFIDPVVGYVFQTRALLLALASGDPERVVCCIAMQAAFSALPGQRSWRRTSRLLERTRELTQQSGTVVARVFEAGMRGIAFFNNGRFREAHDNFGHALALLEDGSRGLQFERISVRVFMSSIATLLGRFKELRVLRRDGLREAHLQENVYASVNMRVHANLAWLVEDQPEGAAEQIRDAMQQWSCGGFHIEHAHALVARITIKRYVCEHAAAYALAHELLSASQRSLLWRVQMVRFRALYSLGGAALSMLDHKLGDSELLLREVRRAVRDIEREKTEWMQPFAHILRAGIAHHEGSPVEAQTLLRAAARELDTHHLAGYAAAARDRAARLLHDASSAPDIAAADRFFREQEVVAPQRLIATLIPGFRSPV